MPNLRCPSCYYSTTIRKEAIEGVCCGTCGFDLFDFYYSGKSASEAASFIAEKGVELKRKKRKLKGNAEIKTPLRSHIKAFLATLNQERMLCRLKKA